MERRCPAAGEVARKRKELGLTQADLGQQAGVSQRMIAAIEGGERRPSIDLAQKIGNVLGIPWPRFFEKDED